MLTKFSGVESQRPNLSLKQERKNFCVVFTYSVKQAREIRKFHVAVVQWRLKNVQKRVMHVQSCYFANINLLLFAVLFADASPSSLLKKSSLLFWSRNFATMVTWRHTSLYYLGNSLLTIKGAYNTHSCSFRLGACNLSPDVVCKKVPFAVGDCQTCTNTARHRKFYYF